MILYTGGDDMSDRKVKNHSFSLRFSRSLFPRSEKMNRKDNCTSNKWLIKYELSG